MKKLLHIIATPREEKSRTLQVSRAFIEEFLERRSQQWELDELNLFTEELPEFSVKRVDGKYQLLLGEPLTAETKKHWQALEQQIERFKAANGYLISTPMWNFSIPYRLKHYLDLIVQPNYLFRYTETGSEGMIKDRKLVVITSRGGDYTIPELKHLDLQEPYLRNLFEFIGFAEIMFINAQPMDAMGEEVRRVKIEEACHKARGAADWIS